MVGDIQDTATLMNVVTVKCVQKGRVKVWMGKPNGLLQILWERGFIDPNLAKVATIPLVVGTTNTETRFLIPVCAT